MKLGLNRTSGLNRILTSWKSQDDPGTGTTYYMINPSGFPHLTLYKNRVPLWQPSPYIGVRLNVIPAVGQYSLFNFSIIIDADEVVLVSTVFNSSIFVRGVVQESGIAQLFTWVENKSEWVTFFTKPENQCDSYGRCGANGNCHSDSMDQIECYCLPGFTAKSPNDWSMRDSSGGGRDLYVRVDALVLAEFQKKGFLSRKKVLATLVGLVSAAAIISLAVSIVLVKKKRKGSTHTDSQLFCVIGSEIGKVLDGTTKDQELPLFDITTIKAATGDFASTNKLGQGGFGPVYKGRLASGQEVAVKRLSKSSGQGSQEFKNEVMLIAKLQHRNLVKLLGCCISQEERMLIYEYLPNKSLDCFIFNEAKRTNLDWNQRFKIILGIARGVLYLHQDSRLKIIHRDLKASNVLLDVALHPKISDFGMAKMFGEDQIQASTNRVVGTYGYMSPEYAMQGLYSIKSDVFSFGVILLEIISGKRNTDFYNDSASLNLIAHVWNLWKEGKSSDIVDSLMTQPYNYHQVSRSIQIGLLCVQEHAADRPTMMDIVLMLGNEAALASPNKPAFILNGSGDVLNLPSTAGASANEVTITELNGR
ncbi:hypothetical protein NL676_007837 [Syzygium grande]|nr:hypothetical protein NL676_007837 [Syzygium grande]